MLKLSYLKESEDILVIYLVGELSSSTCSDFSINMANEVKSKPYNIVLDFSKLTYISSAGLRFLVILFKSLAAQKKKLLIINPSNIVKDVLRVSGFIKLISVYDNLDEAKKTV